MSVWQWIGVVALVWVGLAMLAAFALGAAVARNERRRRPEEAPAPEAPARPSGAVELDRADESGAASTPDPPDVPAPRLAADDQVQPRPVEPGTNGQRA